MFHGFLATWYQSWMSKNAPNISQGQPEPALAWDQSQILVSAPS